MWIVTLYQEGGDYGGRREGYCWGRGSQGGSGLGRSSYPHLALHRYRIHPVQEVWIVASYREGGREEMESRERELKGMAGRGARSKKGRAHLGEREQGSEPGDRELEGTGVRREGF